jgi:MGT family glycosyltransferase
MYAEALTEEVAALAPGLILYDTFTVVAPVIARRLGIPYVNVCAGHAMVPARVREALRTDPRVATSAECWKAVRRLEDVHGMRGANPFSYVEAMSPYLNLYGEPEEYLGAEDRGAFEPVAFFGSLAPSLRENGGGEVFPPERRGPRVYVSFGTVVWWYFAPAATAALRVISETLGEARADVVIALGRHPLKPEARASLERPNVRVVDYVDQWEALREADLFITHNGLNSTHEAIYHLVPMISYPFFTDQPALARRCQALGLAVPLADGPQAAVESARLLLAVKRLQEERGLFLSRLTAARAWELRTIADREGIFDRIIALTGA